MMRKRRVVRSLADYENVTLDVHQRDEKGRTFLHLAANDGNITLVDYMIHHGADLNAKDEEGQTPLHTATLVGELPVVIQLVFNGADVRARDNRQRTPLHDAAIAGETGIVNYLLMTGSDIEPKDADGKMPLDLAKNAYVAKYLKERAETRLFKKEQDRLAKIMQEEHREVLEAMRAKMALDDKRERGIRPKRDVQNLPSTSSLTICEWTRRMINTRDESSIGPQQRNVDLSQVNNLLMLACNLAIFKGSRQSRQLSQSPLHQTLADRMDEVAIHAVHDFLSE